MLAVTRVSWLTKVTWPLLEAFSQAFPYRNFDPHYSKGDGWVQEILYAPQVPYLHGMTMPTHDAR